MEMRRPTQSDEDVTDFKPRPYQIQLFEIVKKKNAIIYLPTGAGKTFIAIMAMKHFASDLQKSIHHGGKRTVYLVNTQELARQQKECISDSTALKVAIYTGDMNVDAWRKDKWFCEFEDNQVLVATCQIVLDVVRHGYIGIHNFNLIIFDECHNGRNDHPMHQLMGLFSSCPVHLQPRVIGLTGMLIGGNVQKNMIVNELQTLENTFRATITTVKTLSDFTNVLLFSTNPDERVIPYRESDPNDCMVKINGIIAKCLEEMEKFVPKSDYKDIRNSFGDFQYQMSDMGIYGASIAIMSLIVNWIMKKKSSETVKRKNTYCHLLTTSETIRHILVKELDDPNEDSETIITNSSQKLSCLIGFLRSYVNKPENKDFKGLVFVQRRYTAKCLYHILKQYAEVTGNFNVKPDFMVGTNNRIPESISAILECKWNKNVLNRFRRNETNLIITTSVLEEGIDLQMCSLVVSYDAPVGFRSYVQRKGRARKNNSTCVIFASEGIYGKLSRQLVEYKAIDSVLKEFLITKAIDRSPPNEDDIQKEHANILIKPFKTPKGACLDALSSVQLLNRYCMTLPNDTFTDSSVDWIAESTIKGIQIKVTLPIESILKEEIVGEPMPNLKMAKRSAAFNACLRLYAQGALNDNLMPITVSKNIENVKKMYLKHWDGYPDDNAKLAGTKKNKRLHPVQYPAETTGSLPQLNMTSYLYILQMIPVFTYDSKDASSSVFEMLYRSDRSFGILTGKKIPCVGEMSFYITLGQVRCQLSKPIEVVLREQSKIDSLKNFHMMLFRDLLQVSKKFFMYDFENFEQSFFVVPTNNNIDWEMVNSHQNMGSVYEKPPSERMNDRFIENDYLYNVICPWYRADQDTRYVVTKIHSHLTPFSSFPNEEFHSYASYYESKYCKRICVAEQFLIEVKGITTHLNRLTPGDGHAGSKQTTFRGPELLIPELCHNFSFPGVLWLKAILIPSFLHRLHYVLLAEMLRGKINNYLNFSNENYNPEPLISKIVKSSTISSSANSKRSIGLPNHESKNAITVRKSDFISLSETADQTWKESEEPIDISRFERMLFEIELDYSYAFITEALQKLNVGKSGCDIGHINNLTTQKQQLPPICEAPLEDKREIKLLNIKNASATNGPKQSELLAAITASSSADVFDMERFEVIGDAFLKFGVSFYLLNNHSEWHEGFLTSCKGQIVSNRNLCYLSMKHNLPGLIKTSQFNPKNDWQPPLLCVPREIQGYMNAADVSAFQLYKLDLSNEEISSGNISIPTTASFVQTFINESPLIPETAPTMQSLIGKQVVSDKMAADCVEAILGVCLTSIGVNRSFSMLQYFNILPSNTNLTNMLANKLKSPRLRPNITDSEIDNFLINHQALEKSIGYTFRDRAYLLQALTHPSFPTNRVTGCYQQLEFLGDACLDFLVSSYIFERCTDMDPGMLTDLRSALVNNVTLACLCVRHKIHLHILSQNVVLSELVQKFVNFQKKHDHTVSEQVQLLFEENDLMMAEYIDVPKALGDIFEAVIGAVFLDSGNDLERTWKVIYHLMKSELESFMHDVPLQIVRRLYEFTGANPKFDEPVVDDEVVMVTVRFTKGGDIFETTGFGTNKENARRAAAKAALLKLTAA